MSFAALAHLCDELSLSSLLTLNVENYLICLVGTNTTTVHDGMTVDFALKILITCKALRYHRLQ